MTPFPSHSQSLLPNPGIIILARIERDADRFSVDGSCGSETDVPRCAVRCQDLGTVATAVVSRTCRGKGSAFCERLPQVTPRLRAPNGTRLRNCAANRLRGRRSSGPRLLARL